MSNITLAPHTVVLVFDEPNSTVNVREVFVTDPSIEVVAVFNSSKAQRPFTIHADKAKVASMLGWRQEVGSNLLGMLAGKLQTQSGDITLSRQDLEDLLRRAGEDTTFKPQTYEAAPEQGGIPLTEGALDEELWEESTQTTPTKATESESISGGDAVQDSSKPLINLMVPEEDAA